MQSKGFGRSQKYEELRFECLEKKTKKNEKILGIVIPRN